MTAEMDTDDDIEEASEYRNPSDYQNQTTAHFLHKHIGGDFPSDTGRVLIQSFTPGVVGVSAIYGKKGDRPYMETLVELDPDQARELGKELIARADEQEK